MNIVFFDPVDWDYDLSTPLDDGLGGSQSALCYLAAALVGRNHNVTVINNTSRRGYRHVDGAAREVLFLGRHHRDEDSIVEHADAVIVLNAGSAVRLRAAGVKAPLVLWSQHDSNQPAVQNMRVAEERWAWDRIVLVSDWQSGRWAVDFGIDEAVVIGNAVAPPFLTEPLRTPWYMAEKPPVLAYTSTPFRGLDKLLDAFPTIRKSIPGVRLKVFSDMRVYRSTEDPYTSLYERCREMDGVEYIGSVGQLQLARELADCAVLAYPCTFPETFCIAASEAVAVGCQPIVPPLGALPETLKDAGIYYDGSFAEVVINVLEKQRVGAMESAVTRDSLSGQFRRECTWAKRAAEWEKMLGKLRK